MANIKHQKENQKVFVRRNSNRRPNWTRILVALSILIVVIVAIVCSISNGIKNANQKEKNQAFIEEQKTEEVLDFTANVEHFEEIPVSATDDCVWGIDISHWQEGIVTEKWIADAKSAGCSFVYIQFAKTAKESNVDIPVLDYRTIAIEFADAAEANELVFGFYFLTDAKYESSRLAEFGFILQFINEIQTKDYQYNRLPLMLDHEVYGNEESAEESDKRVLMLEKQVSSLKQIGIETIVYTSASKYQELAAALGDEQDFWLADYSVAQPGVAPTDFPDKYSEQVAIWQYSADTLSLQERGLPVIADYNPTEQQALDRNLMKTDFFQECIN